jgi:coenzyme F420-0:L-glutamate ligase/coenzyme F420-1:gamma-L-glutamate ligase
MLPRNLSLTAVPGVPLVRPGDDLAALLIAAVERAGIVPADKDILVIAQKIVSKAEGRYVALEDVAPSPRARELAQAVGKDPRIVEIILSESEEVVRHRPGVLVVAHKLGFVMANAGLDQSNLEPNGGRERVLLLPEDPDASSAALKERFEAHYGVELAVVISDTVGRAWRNGAVGTALGAAGLPPLDDMIGRGDLYGRRLEVTQVGLADEVAAAASLLMGQADEGLPLVLLRGLDWAADAAGAKALLRPKDEDLFR